MVGERSPEEQPLEVAANVFAAATLLPAAAFLNMAKSYQSASRGEDSSLKAFAQRLKVSPEVILRRLATLGIVSNSIYRSKRQAWGEKLWYISAPSKGGGPPVPITTLAKDGRGYTRLVLDAYDQRLINTSAASDYLGVKARHFPDLRRELSQRPTLGHAPSLNRCRSGGKNRRQKDRILNPAPIMKEAETRAEHIDPALKAAGWGVVEGSRIRREYPITLGRIEGHGRRGKALTADYILEYCNRKLGVDEAKAWDKPLTEGVAQAKDYAAKLDLRWAFATNGQGIYQIDMGTGKEGEIASYPTPEEL